MARRRAITEEQNHNEDFNKLSLEAEHLWYRMLSASDDFGIVPANAYWLRTRLNLKAEVGKDPLRFMDEIIELDMGFRFEHSGRQFFAFKSKSFFQFQSQFVRKRKVSEFLNVKKDEAEIILGIKPDSTIRPGTSGNIRIKFPNCLLSLLFTLYSLLFTLRGFSNNKK